MKLRLEEIEKLSNKRFASYMNDQTFSSLHELVKMFIGRSLRTFNRTKNEIVLSDGTHVPIKLINLDSDIENIFNLISKALKAYASGQPSLIPAKGSRPKVVYRRTRMKP